MSDHVRTQEEIAARVKALESILIEKGIMTTAAAARPAGSGRWSAVTWPTADRVWASWATVVRRWSMSSRSRSRMHRHSPLVHRVVAVFVLPDRGDQYIRRTAVRNQRRDYRR